MYEDELMHHGIKGQKWGVRRYQNKDGSLTYAGKKRALKLQNQYTELSKNKKYHDKDGNLTYEGRKKALKMKESYSQLTGGKSLRKFQTTGDNGKTIQTKSINEMSNSEIQAKIDRIRLENTLSSLTPKQTSPGAKFISGIKEASISIAKDKGTKIVGDYIDKQVRKKLGLDKKEMSEAEKLKQEAMNYINRQTIDRGQQYFKEGKYADKKDKSVNDSAGKYTDEPLHGTVEGEGTNSSSNKKSSQNENYRYDEPIDTDWKDAKQSDTSRGEAYINQLLLEDKRR